MSDPLEIPPIPLAATLDTAAAPQLHSSLQEQDGQSILLDASRVEHLGALCFQVLLGGQKHWQSQNLDFQVINPSPRFREELTLLGGIDIDLLGSTDNG